MFKIFFSLLVVEFEPLSGNYYPILYINDYWNLMRDYTPINETVKYVWFSFKANSENVMLNKNY